VIKTLARKFLHPVPVSLATRQRRLSEQGLERLRDSLARNYYQGWRHPENYTADGYRADLHNHLLGRIEKDRRLVVPWLNAARPLQGMRILEVGAGTGSSTVALAEQGAHVVGIDIDEGALAVAADRLGAYGVEADLRFMNVIDAARTFASNPPDMIVFFACLEHMTLQERLEALPAMWSLLRSDGLLVIVETPNRLWYTDPHTSRLPYFHWLPDELALLYSRFSPREVFKDRYREPTPKALEDFARQGRGVSYHELDLTMGPVEGLKVISSLSSFRGWRHEPRRSWRDRRFARFLRTLRPEIHEGFSEPWLDLVIERA
jgi:2-polyprenyl-3-methyl-5-hydroxy-6-metoxy-1,4-benzoquinol methylase